MADVAILGVGKMGSAMARELVAAGHQVRIWNRTNEKSEKLALEIANSLLTVTLDPVEAVAASEFVIAIFADGKTTQSVFLADPRLIESAKAGTIFVDMGTSGVDTAKMLSQKFASEGFDFVDAPVSGSVSTIAAHQLLVMASGPTPSIDRLRPVLLAFSKLVSNLGAAGNGQSMKLSVNLVVHSLNAAIAEALALATASGIEASAAYDIFDESVIAAPFVKYKRSAFLDADTPVAMRMDTVVKDLGLIRRLGATAGVKLEAICAVEDLYRQACANGYEAKDMASLVHFLR